MGDFEEQPEIMQCGVPNQGLVDGIVLVAEHISGGGDKGQSISGCRTSRSVGSLRETSEMISRARVTAYTVLRSARKLSIVNPVVNDWTASTFSMMSAKRWAGFLEGIYCVLQNIIAQKRFQRPQIHHIRSTAE